MRAWRWPIVLLAVALLVAALLVEHDRERVDEVATAEASAFVPTASPPGSLGSTWYCASGTATGTDEGDAEQVVSMANASGEVVQGRLTVYPNEGDPVTRPVELPARDRVTVRVSDIAQARYASVLAEFDGGEVAVQHELSGPTGRTVGACASAPAATWYFPNATTRPGTRLLLTLFNPFPNDAVVDIALEAEDGTRTPQAYQGLVVPAQRVTTLDVHEVVTLRQELAATVVVRSGRVVAEQVQIVSDADDLPDALVALLGAPQVEPIWIFPDGVGGEGYEERVALYNPGNGAAEVDVEVLLDDPETYGVAEPFERTVQPGGYTIVDVFGDGRVPRGAGHAIVVRARNDVSVVAQRVVVGQEEADRSGISYTLGAPVVAGRWIAPVGSTGGDGDGSSERGDATLVVSNPSPTETVTFTLRAFDGGEATVVAGFDGATLGPLSRAQVDVPAELAGRRIALEVDATARVVAEMRFGFAGDGIASLVAVPVAGTVSAPTDVVGELSQQTVVLGGG